MKHSPAPWTEYEDDDGNVIVKMDDAHDVLIANLEGSCGTCHANARLIAAAPELLHALQQLIEAVSMMRCDPMPVQHITQANNAIKKATLPQ